LECEAANSLLRYRVEDVFVRLSNTSPRRRRKQGAVSHDVLDVDELGEQVEVNTISYGNPDPSIDASGVGKIGSLAVTSLLIRGVLSSEDYGELFRTIITPMDDLGHEISLKVEIRGRSLSGSRLDPSDPRLRRLREAARRLELDLDVEARPT
jgi:hypothetical protein